ncbi:hypothetical protein OROGR_028319 [Orobanche gracilis]
MVAIDNCEALKKRHNARTKCAKFLQETVKEMAKEVQISRSGKVKKTAEDLDDFMSKVKKGDLVYTEEILGFAKLFNDELTLDNMSRCKIGWTYLSTIQFLLYYFFLVKEELNG